MFFRYFIGISNQVHAALYGFPKSEVSLCFKLPFLWEAALSLSQAFPRDHPPLCNVRVEAKEARCPRGAVGGDPWAAPAGDCSPLTLLPWEREDHLNRP